MEYHVKKSEILIKEKVEKFEKWLKLKYYIQK